MSSKRARRRSCSIAVAAKTGRGATATTTVMTAGATTVGVTTVDATNAPRVKHRRWRPKWKARENQAAARAEPQPPRVLPSAQILPVLGAERSEDRLQGRAALAALHLRARQDCAEPHHRGFDQ